MDSLKRLVDEFSRFARLPEIRLEDANVNRILENTLSLYDGRIQDVRMRKDLDPDIPNLSLDPEQMKRVFINVFDNALEAMAKNPGDKVAAPAHQPRCATEDRCASKSATPAVGFPEEYQDSMFLPYFSTRKGGTGLGLAIVRQIITDHRGNVRVEPNTPVGSKIIIDLPLSQPDSGLFHRKKPVIPPFGVGIGIGITGHPDPIPTRPRFILPWHLVSDHNKPL